jgi:hypothetical protein
MFLKVRGLSRSYCAVSAREQIITLCGIAEAMP